MNGGLDGSGIPCVKSSAMKAKLRNLHLLTHAGYMAAIQQLICACGTTACAIRVASGDSFTDLGRMDSLADC